MKLEQAARQALGALVRAEAMYGQPNADIQTALREALAEQAEQEPVVRNPTAAEVRAYRDEHCCTMAAAKSALISEQDSKIKTIKQSPVAEVILRYQPIRFDRAEECKDIVFFSDIDVGTKLYAAPVRVQDLTDDEIEDVCCRLWSGGWRKKAMNDFARAVITKFKEKNK